MKPERLLALASVFFVACATAPVSPPAKEAVPVAPPPAIASSAPIAPAAEVASADAVLGPELFAPAGTHPRLIFSVDDVLVVVDETRRVGGVKGDSITWLDRTLPPPRADWGESIEIHAIGGRWPDRVDVLYVVTRTRSPYAHYLPLTGEGRAMNPLDSSRMYGLAVVGDTVLVATDESNASIQTVRGPTLVRKPVPWRKLCKDGEAWDSPPPKRAVSPFAFGGSRAETLVGVGFLCQNRYAPAAEVWDKTGASRVIELGAWVKDDIHAARVLRGSGDELFLVPGGGSPLLSVKAGSVAPVLPLEKPRKNVFVSTKGQLHVSDGRTVHRLDAGGWTDVAHLAWPETFDAMAVDGDTLWGSRQGSVFRMRPVHDVAWREGCATPFVYLYDASPNNGDHFTYPETRKALSSFGDLAGVSLVEFREGVARLGLVVSSKAQGEAVIAHVKAAMKNESPTLLCYEPKAPRRLEIATPSR